MNLACSSVFSGGGTNQELVLHCLHECGGNILVSKRTNHDGIHLYLCRFYFLLTLFNIKETLERLMLQDPIFPKGHHLAGYHYSGKITSSLSVHHPPSLELSLVSVSFPNVDFTTFTGSDSWTAEEKCYFNKGISAYRKDFFLVQKLVRVMLVSCRGSNKLYHNKNANHTY